MENGRGQFLNLLCLSLYMVCNTHLINSGKNINPKWLAFIQPILTRDLYELGPEMGLWIKTINKAS